MNKKLISITLCAVLAWSVDAMDQGQAFSLSSETMFAPVEVDAARPMPSPEAELVAHKVELEQQLAELVAVNAGNESEDVSVVIEAFKDELRHVEEKIEAIAGRAMRKPRPKARIWCEARNVAELEAMKSELFDGAIILSSSFDGVPRSPDAERHGNKLHFEQKQKRELQQRYEEGKLEDLREEQQVASATVLHPYQSKLGSDVFVPMVVQVSEIRPPLSLFGTTSAGIPLFEGPSASERKFDRVKMLRDMLQDIESFVSGYKTLLAEYYQATKKCSRIEARNHIEGLRIDKQLMLFRELLKNDFLLKKLLCNESVPSQSGLLMADNIVKEIHRVFVGMGRRLGMTNAENAVVVLSKMNKAFDTVLGEYRTMCQEELKMLPAEAQFHVNHIPFVHVLHGWVVLTESIRARELKK